MIEALLQTILGPLGGILAAAGAVVLALVLGRSQGARKANDKRDADDAKNYIEERRRQDEIDVGAGATDGQRIELLKAIRDRNRSGKD